VLASRQYLLKQGLITREDLAELSARTFSQTLHPYRPETIPSLGFDSSRISQRFLVQRYFENEAVPAFLEQLDDEGLLLFFGQAGDASRWYRVLPAKGRFPITDTMIPKLLSRKMLVMSTEQRCADCHEVATLAHPEVCAYQSKGMAWNRKHRHDDINDLICRALHKANPSCQTQKERIVPMPLIEPAPNNITAVVTTSADPETSLATSAFLTTPPTSLNTVSTSDSEETSTAPKLRRYDVTLVIDDRTYNTDTRVTTLLRSSSSGTRAAAASRFRKENNIEVNSKIPAKMLRRYGQYLVDAVLQESYNDKKNSYARIDPDVVPLVFSSDGSLHPSSRAFLHRHIGHDKMVWRRFIDDVTTVLTRHMMTIGSYLAEDRTQQEDMNMMGRFPRPHQRQRFGGTNNPRPLRPTTMHTARSSRPRARNI
jgi:hypothetical protein